MPEGILFVLERGGGGGRGDADFSLLTEARGSAVGWMVGWLARSARFRTQWFGHGCCGILCVCCI